uniref:Phosphatidate cytidylyltransferase n=1 Tax=Candidatus Kentrum sp. TUN TaxID=2126343 RepID=A0A450ZR34_9GAMM|nr:MAG: phosphatidate cytidylyltransferase [Candidatus Kentron sp. TUN]VFK56289.1 MAG: phosphatidate cytidylyltransferase [Candidatus Kentron sp. TUN]VFK64879.1 MAG: phosphatidate cytidylyltransferase [Candidatus Kentron sp. TUN]
MKIIFGNLIQRVATAVLLAPLVILSILMLPTFYFGLGLVAMILVGAWEWARLAGYTSKIKRIAYVLATAVLLYVAFRLDAIFPYGWLLLSITALVWWCVALGLVVQFEQGISISFLKSPVVRVFVGWLILVPTWGALAVIHRYAEIGPILIVLLMMFVWGADTGAYFFGKRFGKKRLSPRISPGKSWEGVAGGALIAGLLSVAVGFYAQFPLEQWIVFIFFSLITVTLSILGDVTESLFKRQVGIKDSGSLLPGHGGVLDRIDSLTATAPFFALSLFLWGYIA